MREVHCSSCDENIDLESVEDVNGITSDIEGKDLISFNCPDCGSKEESYIQELQECECNV